MENITWREEFKLVVQRIPEDELGEARRLLRELLVRREKQALDKRMTPEEFQAYLDNAPEEDEEITEEEWQAIEEGRAAVRRGDYHSLESVMEELGIEN